MEVAFTFAYSVSKLFYNVISTTHRFIKALFRQFDNAEPWQKLLIYGPLITLTFFGIGLVLLSPQTRRRKGLRFKRY